jgi:hypothetical protein
VHPHGAADNRNITGMHWEVLPHFAYSPDLAPSDFHLFGPFDEALGGKIFRTDDEKIFLCNDGWKSNDNFFGRGIMELPER